MTFYERAERFLDHITAERASSLVVFVLMLWDQVRRRLGKSEIQNLEVQTIKKEKEMEKAFDLKNLAERLKAKGLPVAEDVLQEATKEIFAWAGESCAIKGGFFAVAVPLLPLVADQVVKLEDGIDGQAGK